MRKVKGNNLRPIACNNARKEGTRRLLLILMLVATLHSSGLAQFTGQMDQKDRAIAEANRANSNVPDSTILNYFTLKDRSLIKSVEDTFFHDFEKYLKQKTFEDATLNLGNLASSSQRIYYQPRNSIHTDIGFHQYDIYRKELEDVPFYRHNRPYNDLFFSPLGGGSSNFLVKAKFARNFDDNVNLSIDYERTNANGIYNAQSNKATALGVGLWRENKSNGHSFFLTFLANNFNETHNGGITEDVDLYDSLYNIGTRRSIRTEIPVNMIATPGISRHQNFTYALDNFFTVKEKLKLHHHISYNHGYYRYGDQGITTAQDTSVYKTYLINSRGIRMQNNFGRWTNQVDVGLDTKSFDLSVGLAYRYMNYNNSVSTTHIHDLNLIGLIGLDIKEFSELRGRVELGIGSNVGNILMDGQLGFQLSKEIDFSANILINRYDPMLIQEELIITTEQLFDNDFGKTNELRIGGVLRIAPANLDLEFTSGILDNPIAYNRDALPYQVDNNIEYIQAKASHRLFWKFIGLENSVIYQSFSDNVFALPTVFGIHNIYLQSTLFKKRLNGQVGIILYNYVQNDNLSFLPVTGTFYPSEESIDKYYYTELYANFKVDRFRIFFKMENFTDMLINTPHFQIVDYPQFDNVFRMGVRWQFYD